MFSPVLSQAFLHTDFDLINIIWKRLFLIVAFPNVPQVEVQNTITTARLLFCLSQSCASDVSSWILNQVLAQSNTRLHYSLWTLLLPGQLPGRLSSGKSCHCFSKSCLWLQRLKTPSHQYADVLHQFCLDIF